MVGEPEVIRASQGVHDKTVSLKGFTPNAPAFATNRSEI